MILWRRWAAAVSGCLLLLVGNMASAALPADKANWVVAVGALRTDTTPAYNNWVRLGYYQFKTDGTVITNWWVWKTLDDPMRVKTDIATDCDPAFPNCRIQTVDGFTDDPMGGFQGTYSYFASTGVVRVTWTKDAAGASITPLTETWQLDKLAIDGVPSYPPKLARIRSANFFVDPPAVGSFSSYSATFGIGYGSNAPLSAASRATMAQLNLDSRYKSRPYAGRIVLANDGVATNDGVLELLSNGTGGYAPQDWSPACSSGLCLAHVSPSSNGCSCANPTGGRMRYVAEIEGGRRNTEWFWCKCLAGNKPCYYANNHVRPSLQIVDEDGVFRGWVGVEAMINVIPNGTDANGEEIFIPRPPEPNKPDPHSFSHFGIFDKIDPSIGPAP